MMVAFLVNSYNNINEIMQHLSGDAAGLGRADSDTAACHPRLGCRRASSDHQHSIADHFQWCGADVHPALLVQAHLIGWVPAP